MGKNSPSRLLGLIRVKRDIDKRYRELPSDGSSETAKKEVNLLLVAINVWIQIQKIFDSMKN